jgi:hypothetical protein
MTYRKVDKLTPNQTHALLDAEIAYLRAVERGLMNLPVTFSEKDGVLEASITFSVGVDLGIAGRALARHHAKIALGQAIAVLASSCPQEEAA